MEYILKLIGSLTVAGSIVVGFILFIRLINPPIFSAKWRYTLGKMAMVFYLFPVVIVMQWLTLFITPASSLEVVIPTAVSSTHEVFMESQLESMTTQALSSISARIVLMIWGLGAFIVVVWQIYCYQKFIKNIKKSASPILENSEITQQLAHLKQQLGIKGTVDIAYSSIIRSPILVGLLRPKIILPASKDLDMDIKMILHHELVHLKRKDLWVKMVLLGVGALHWFNPFVYILRKDIHLWSELSCDEEVVKEMTFTERKRYGETILNVVVGAKDLPVRFCIALSGDGQRLKRRLMMMLHVKKPRKKSVFLATITILVIGIIGLSTAVWAANNSPEVVAEPIAYEGIEVATEKGSIAYEGIEVATEKGSIAYEGIEVATEKEPIVHEGIGGGVHS